MRVQLLNLRIEGMSAISSPSHSTEVINVLVQPELSSKSNNTVDTVQDNEIPIVDEVTRLLGQNAKDSSDLVIGKNSTSESNVNISISNNEVKKEGLDSAQLVEANSQVSNPLVSQPVVKIGFVMRKANSESLAQQDLERIVERHQCLLDELVPDADILMDFSNSETWQDTSYEHTFIKGEAGLYSFVFVRCGPKHSQHRVSFNVRASFINPGPNYLSAGDAPLPVVYFVFFLLFTIALGEFLEFF